jgi:hypothetical protein
MFSIRAFLLFTRHNPVLMEGLIENDILFSKLSDALYELSPDIRIISRIATLLSQMITTFPEQSTECCGFVVKLIEFSDEPGVFDLIEQICAPKSKLTAIQVALLEAQFSEVLMNEVVLETANEARMASLIRIIRYSAANPVLSPGFRTPRILQTLAGLLGRASPSVAGELWLAASRIVCGSNLASAELFLTPAVARVSEYSAAVVYAQMHAVEFLARMLELGAKAAAACIDRALLEVILRLTVQFADSSNYMGAVFRFIRAGILWGPLTELLVAVFVPAMAAEASDTMRTAASAQSFVLLDELEILTHSDHNLATTLQTLDIFTEFCRRELKGYRKIMSHDYGGPVQAVPVFRTALFAGF